MNKIVFCNILIIIGLSIGCHKVELDPIDGVPVFEASAISNGIGLSWQAGVDGYYMFSSFEEDPFNVYIFKGLLAPENNNCCNTIEFNFRDFRQSNGVEPDISKAISTDIVYIFANNSGNDTISTIETDTNWLASFNVSSFSQPQQALIYEWDYGDQTGETTMMPDSVFHSYNQSPDNQLVTLSAKTQGNNCSSYFKRQISTSNNPSQNCNLTFSPDSITNTAIKITANFTGTPPFSYAWSDSSSFPSITITPSPVGPTEFSVTVTDALGCSVNAGISTTVTLGTIPPICFAAFDYSVQEVITDTTIIEIEYADSLQFSAVTVIYSDINGNKYRSDRHSQVQDAFLEVLAVEDYDDNEKGENTKKVYLKFSCRVWNEQGDYIDLKEGKAVIAVAYPD